MDIYHGFLYVSIKNLPSSFPTPVKVTETEQSTSRYEMLLREERYENWLMVWILTRKLS